MNRYEWQLMAAGHFLATGRTVAEVVDILGVSADSHIAEAMRAFVARRKSLAARAAARRASATAAEPVQVI
jgi:hypothetical protein